MTKYYQRCAVFNKVIDRATGGMKQAFQVWLKSLNEQKAGIEHVSMLKLVTKMQQVFVKRAHRVFNPPIIIKDADAIMRKTVHRLMKVRDNLFENAMLRWKGKIFADKHH
jgi:hypothetical protein